VTQPAIVRFHGSLTLMDRDSLARYIGTTPGEIRKRCKHVAADWATWRTLWNAEQVAEVFGATLPSWVPHFRVYPIEVCDLDGITSATRRDP